MDYAKEEQWHAWNKEALKRFLYRPEQQGPDVGGTVPYYLTQPPIMVTAPKFDTNKEPWWPPSTNPRATTTPLVLEEKPDLFGLESVFTDCNQVVALEDDMWDFAPVSIRFNVLDLFC